MIDKKSSTSRRKLLKSIAAGSGAIVVGKSLPDSWSRPVVDSVMLPAHARTSLSNGPFAGNATTNGTSLETDSIFAKASDSLIQQAQAGLIISLTPYVCVTPNSSLDAAKVELYRGTTRYTFTDVPLGESKCEPDISMKMCQDDKDVDASSILEGLGLINDAHAEPPSTYCCFLTSITGTGAGRIESNQFPTVEFNVNPNTCNPPDPCLPVAGSDIRLKTNIEALSVSRNGYNLYKFQYIDENDENTYVGVMAQDIISRNPEAVIQNGAGFYMVRYAQLGLKMVTLKQWESEGPDSVELMH